MPNLRSALGHPLTAAEFDANTTEFDTRLTAIETNPKRPRQFTSVSLAGLAYTFHLDDGSSLAPVAAPVLEIRFRGAWFPGTDYEPMDFVVVDAGNIYSVLIEHTSDTTFDPNRLIGGLPAYNQIWAAQETIYDIEFVFDGALVDMAAGGLNFLALRAFTVPVLGGLAYLKAAPTFANQVLPIYHNTTAIGSVTFLVGAHVGTVVITAATSIPVGDRLTVGVPGTTDPSAAGMTVAFAASRVLA